MKNAVVLLGLVAFILSSCGDKKNEEKVTQNDMTVFAILNRTARVGFTDDIFPRIFE